MGDKGEIYSEEEIKARAQAALKRMIETPHKPQGLLVKRGAPRKLHESGKEGAQDENRNRDHGGDQR